MGFFKKEKRKKENVVVVLKSNHAIALHLLLSQ